MTSTTTTSDTTKTLQPRRPYPIGVPNKFSPEGHVQRYPGNTTLCHVALDSPLQPSLRAIYTTITSHPTISKRVQILPPASWHMTILDGVREKECEPGMWPPGMEKQPLAECSEEFAHRLRKLGLGLVEEGLAPPYRVRVSGFGRCVVGLGLEIEGATAGEEMRLRRLRDRIADTFGFRAPNHDSYGFHITMAYLIRHIDGEERQELNRVLAQLFSGMQREFELGAVEFCTFENMYAFSRLFYLGERDD